MSKKNKIAMIVIIIAIILIVGSTYTVIWKRGITKYGYKVPHEISTTFTASSGNWTGVLIDNDIKYTDGAHNIVPYDIDGDGEVELIANSYRSDALMFYKYDGDPHKSSNWRRYVIDSSVGGGNPRGPVIKFIKSTLKEKLLGGFTGGAHYTAIDDINGDGLDDLIVAGDLKNYDVVWYETPMEITNVSLWRKHYVYKNDLHRTYHVETGDIDGDGDQDIVFGTKTDNSVGWLENVGSLNNWPVFWVDNNCVRCFNVRVADIDKNGKNDIIASEDDSTNGGKLHFYSYSNDPKLQENWIDHTIVSFPGGHGVSVFEIVDIDNDGDSDIVSGNHQGDIYVLENPYPYNVDQEWNKYSISRYNVNSGHDLREIDVGDIDGDGDLDIVVADEDKNMVIWFENSDITFSENWKEHVIDKSDQYLKWCHAVELGDIDGDGDLDIAVAVAGSNTFLWYFKGGKGIDE